MSRSKVIQTGKNAIVEYLDLDICYSAKGTKGKWRYASSKARKKPAPTGGRQISKMRHLPAVDRFKLCGR